MLYKAATFKNRQIPQNQILINQSHLSAVDTRLQEVERNQ